MTIESLNTKKRSLFCPKTRRFPTTRTAGWLRVSWDLIVPGLSLAVLASCVLALAAIPMMAAPVDAPWQPAPPATLELSMWATTQEGPTERRGYATLNFDPTGEGEVCLWARQDGPGRDIGRVCGFGIGSCHPRAGKGAANRWRFVARLLEIEGGATQWHLRGERLAGAGSAPYSGILSLRFGEKRIVDYWQAEDPNSPGDCEIESMLLQIEALPGAAVQSAAAVQRGELGLRWTDHEGTKTGENLVVATVHGEESPFAFQPIRLPISGLRLGGEKAGLLLVVDGNLRLWPGQAHTVAALGLRLSYGVFGGSGRASRGSGGRKHLELGPGEEVEVLVPTPSGTYDLQTWSQTERAMIQAQRDTAQPLAPGVEGSDETGYKLHLGPFWKE